MSYRNPSVLILAALIAATTARAEIYTWTDEDGVTHYTDTPRQDGAHEEHTRPELTNSPMALPEPGTWEVQHDNDEDEASTPSRAEREAAATEKRCQRYETRLDSVNEELGRGYQEPRGNQLRAERRKLRSKIFSEC